MSTLINILLAMLIISVVIVFHELGHFLVAKANGIVVTEFSLGMGPRIISKEIGGTRYSWKLLPLGGSCMMLGEDEGSDEPGTFNSKTVWQRISVVFAGPLFNFILAFIIGCVILGILGYDQPFVYSIDESVAEATGLQSEDILTSYNGHKIHIGREMALYEQLDGIDDSEITITYERDGKEYEATYNPILVEGYYMGIQYTASESDPVILSGVAAKGAAEAAGLKAGDKIIGVDGTELLTVPAFQEYLDEHPLTDKTVKLTVEREGKQFDVSLKPTHSSSYSLGFYYNYSYREKIGFFDVIKYGVIEVNYWIKSTIKSLGYIIQGKASTEDIGGPVRIVSEMSNVVEESYRTDGLLYAFMNLINWGILLSANLGVMNLLPIPALDGGRLLFLFIEVVRGKRMDPEKEGMVHFIGFVLLILLMLFIFFNDIRNVLP